MEMRLDEAGTDQPAAEIERLGPRPSAPTPARRCAPPAMPISTRRFVAGFGDAGVAQEEIEGHGGGVSPQPGLRLAVFRDLRMGSRTTRRARS